MESSALLAEIRALNFRSARSVVLRPGPICAFIGEPGAGKSNLLFALRALLDPDYDLSTADVTERAEKPLGRGDAWRRPRDLARRSRRRPTDRPLPGGAARRRALHGDAARLERESRGRVDAARARALARAARRTHPAALEACGAEASGRRVRDRGSRAVPRPSSAIGTCASSSACLAEGGNQIFFTTHAPGLLSVGALEAGPARRSRRAGRDDGGASAPHSRRRHLPC